MKIKNRFLGGMCLTFHSMGFLAAAAIIIRMVAAIIKVHTLGTDVRYNLSDEYSAIRLFLVGFFMYSRYTGLSASVNLSAYKKVFALAAAALGLSMLFVLFDMALVKGYFSEIFSLNLREYTLNTYWEEVLISRHNRNAEFFSADGAVLFFKLTLVYHVFILGGYITRYMLSANPLILVLWIAPMLLLYAITYDDNMPVNVFTVIVVWILIIITAVSASPFLFGFITMCICGAENTGIFIFLLTVIWLMYVIVISCSVSIFKPKLKTEKRREISL